MKKFFFLGIAATAMLASCTNDETVEMNPQNAIAFETFVDKSTRAVEDVTLTNLGTFELYGWRGNDLIFNKQGVTVTQAGVCSYSPTQYWAAGKEYTFEAVAPKSGDKGVTFTASKGTSTITFDSNSETDLIYATKTTTTTADLSTAPAAVGLNFEHLLSRVKFTFVNGAASGSAATITVTDVKITNAGTTAIYTPSTGTWAAATANSNITFASTNIVNIAGNGSAETEHKYLIPYDVKDYLLSFTVTMTQGSVTDTFNYSDNYFANLASSAIKTSTLEKGKSYNFIFTFNPGHPITFTATVTPWDDFSNVTIP